MKQKKVSRIMVAAALVATGVVFSQSAGLGCASMAGEQGLSAVDFCFLFDCQNGALGGLIDFCANNTTPDGNTANTYTFLDCPDLQTGSF